MRVVAVLCLLALACTVEAGTTRRVYIAADEVEWDYAVKGDYYEVDRYIEYRVDAPVFLEPSPDRIGKVYTKAIYREYTDATFTTLAPRPRDMEHLGLLGPTIWAEVGDIVELHFKNNARFEFSVHPHGVYYTKDAEGAKYPDNALPAGDAIPPGETYTYIWPIPARAGTFTLSSLLERWIHCCDLYNRASFISAVLQSPVPSVDLLLTCPRPRTRRPKQQTLVSPLPVDPSFACQVSDDVRLYHGHVDEVIATNVALMGCLVVTSKGMAFPDGKPKDVDREIFLVANIFNENVSPFLDLNMETHLTTDQDFEELKEDEDFQESNLLHALNGYVYNNVPGLFMDQGDRVRWYIGGLGTDVDLHTFKWHGASVADHGVRESSVRLIASETTEVDMIADRVGQWIIHCSVNDHIAAGMEALYTVRAADLYHSFNYETLSDKLYGGDDDDDDSAGLVTSSSASALSVGVALLVLSLSYTIV